MLVSTGFIYLAILGNTLAVVNQPCVGKDGRAGVCLKTSDCSKDGGESIKGACAKDPDDVRCCTKATCTDNSKRDEIVAGGLPRHLARAAFSGNCRWSSDCAGKTQNSLCPGPGEFKCCDSNKEGFGGYGDTNDNWKGGCKAKAIKGAELIVKEFGSRVRAVGCLRDCAAGDSSDHCDGMATDLMCSDETERPTMSGEDIATWVMNHREELGLKYVIWGQRIWSLDRNPPDQPKPWEEWRVQDPKGDSPGEAIRLNHWDHVHVSYK